MNLTWRNRRGDAISWTIPAHLRAYVDAIGLDIAATLFFEMGGAPAYIAKNPAADSLISQTIGVDNVRKLAGRFEGPIARLPNDRAFLVRYFRSQGMSVLSIARKMRLSDVTVRKHLADPAKRREDKHRKRIFTDLKENAEFYLDQIEKDPQ